MGPNAPPRGPNGLKPLKGPRGKKNCVAVLFLDHMGCSNKCFQPVMSPYVGLRGSTSNSKGTWSTHKPPLFVVSEPQNHPTRRLGPRTSGHLVDPEGGPACTRWGPTLDPPGSPGRNKGFLVCRPFGMEQPVFLARLKLVLTRRGPCTMATCLENAPLGDEKMGQKGVKSAPFQKLSSSDPCHCFLRCVKCPIHTPSLPGVGRCRSDLEL